MRTPGTLAALVILAAACGGGQTRLNLFSTEWEDDGGLSIARVQQQLASASVAANADVAVGVAGHADKLVGLPLDGGPKWTFAHPIDARPVVAGGVVVASDDSEVFALDAASGRVMWRRPTGGLALLGAGDDGTVTAATFKQAGGVGSVLLAVTHDGQVVRQIESDKMLGAPAVLGHMVFVPWSSQYVSVIDLANGDEAARVTLRDQTTRAWAAGGALWFGESAFVRFDARIRDASKGKASRASLPSRELPGTPKLTRPGSEPAPATTSADDKTRLYARPSAEGSGASIGDGRWYATYFRVAMGFDADKGQIAWAHLHEADFVGGAAAKNGVVLCDAEGKVETIDSSTGEVVGALDLGEPIQSCVVSADGRAVPGKRLERKPLAAQLAEAVLVDEPQMVIAQKLLLRELTAVQDELATKTLVDLASDPRTSPDLLVEARTALANRRNGPQHMIAALQRHYDYLKDVLRAPPVGPCAQALAAMKTKEAAPLLASHLFDPADTSDDVKQAAAALAVVGGPAELPALRQFFGMYRATADGEDVSAAVVSVAQAMVALDDKAGRPAIEAAAKDDSTVPQVKDRLGALVKR